MAYVVYEASLDGEILWVSITNKKDLKKALIMSANRSYTMPAPLRKVITDNINRISIKVVYLSYDRGQAQNYAVRRQKSLRLTYEGKDISEYKDIVYRESDISLGCRACSLMFVGCGLFCVIVAGIVLISFPSVLNKFMQLDIFGNRPTIETFLILIFVNIVQKITSCA